MVSNGPTRFVLRKGRPRGRLGGAACVVVVAALWWLVLSCREGGALQLRPEGVVHSALHAALGSTWGCMSHWSPCTEASDRCGKGTVGAVMRTNAGLIDRVPTHYPRRVDLRIPMGDVGQVSRCWDDSGSQAPCWGPSAAVEDALVVSEYDIDSHLVTTGVARDGAGALKGVDRFHKFFNHFWFVDFFYPYEAQPPIICRQLWSLGRVAVGTGLDRLRVIEEPVFWAFDMFLSVPSSMVQDFLDAAASYHRDGLDIPWLLPDVSHATNPLVRRDHPLFSEFFVRHMGVRVIRYAIGEVHLLRRVHLPYMGHGIGQSTLSPSTCSFKDEVFVPRVLESLRQRDEEPPRKKVMLQVKLSSGPKSFTMTRAFNPSDSFERLVDRVAGAEGAVWGDASMSIDHKVFYANTAPIIIASWGSANDIINYFRASEVVQSAIVLIHPAYVLETLFRPEGARYKCGDGSEIFTDCHPKNASVKYLWIESLDDVTEEDILDDSCRMPTAVS